MVRRSKNAKAIRDFIIAEVTAHPADIAATTVHRFGIARVTANRYIQQLVAEGVLLAAGTTRARRYELRELAEARLTFRVNELNGEDRVWTENLRPLLNGLPGNVLDILQYGATEMINNVIDHSDAGSMFIVVRQNAQRTRLVIADNGIGVFEKIKRDCGLADTRHALLELSKGKLTTAPSRHSGEGLFFTSRMFNIFVLSSRGLEFIRTREDDDEWLFEVKHPEESYDGTAVTLEISNSAHHTCLEVFEKFQDDDDAPGFAKTHVPVRLAKYPGEQLVSRSQARRVLARFERFSEVMLDFADVAEIGQAFADEIFRVYALEHPEVDIIPIRVTPAVQRMIEHVLAGARR
jgi:anti-sigma regulatory factor (Ser/Thr protein kinase)